MNVAVVIPIYKNTLTKIEIASLERLKELYKTDIFFVGPKKIENSGYIKNSTNIPFISYPDSTFESISSYNKLMLSTSFYQSFLEKGYTWILIAQLDTYIFKSNLEDFTKLDSDYFGAPWKDGQLVTQNLIHPKLLRLTGKKVFVGNGGLSLRRINKTIELLNKKRKEADSWTFNEDAFFSYYGVKTKFFKSCSIEVAASFAIETDCEYFYKMNGNSLPFGCHAFEKYDHDFYEKHIPNYRSLIDS